MDAKVSFYKVVYFYQNRKNNDKISPFNKNLLIKHDIENIPVFFFKFRTYILIPTKTLFTYQNHFNEKEKPIILFL